MYMLNCTVIFVLPIEVVLLILSSIRIRDSRFIDYAVTKPPKVLSCMNICAVIFNGIIIIISLLSLNVYSIISRWSLSIWVNIAVNIILMLLIINKQQKLKELCEKYKKMTSVIYCPSCGKACMKYQEFCPECGVDLRRKK